MTTYTLADQLTEHMRRLRGYALSVGGYHTQGGGFWLSAAYWANIGVFALGNVRNRGGAQPAAVDNLIKAFSTGVMTAPDSLMLDPKRYRTHQVYLGVVAAPVPTSVQHLLASAHVSPKPAPGFTEVTLAEFLPVSARLSTANSAATSTATSTSALAGAPASALAAGAPAAAPRTGSTLASTRKRPLALGERCSVCGEVAVERPLLTSVYIGCRCG